jgi:hypothetical protein
MAGLPCPENESMNSTPEGTTVIVTVAVFDGTLAQFAW